MEMEDRTTGGYRTKRCPRCGAELYEDMSVCYGCLYDFSRDVSRAPSDDAVPADAGATVDLAVLPPLARRHEGELGVVLRSASVDMWAPVGERGISVGRGEVNDLVLHSLAVSRCHLRLVPTPDGMEVTDLGSTNWATYRGRGIEGSVVVPYGEVIDVCGNLLAMTGPSAVLGGAPSAALEKSL